MWAAVDSWSIEDGRLPAFCLGDRLTTDLAIFLSDTDEIAVIAEPRRAVSLADSGPGPRNAHYRIEGEVLDFDGFPNLWLIDAGEAILLPEALTLPARPQGKWDRVQGHVVLSTYGYRTSPGYRSWLVRQILRQQAPKTAAGGGVLDDPCSVHETEIAAVQRWAERPRHLMTRYLVDLVEPQDP
jgi:hypothetical protein